MRATPGPCLPPLDPKGGPARPGGLEGSRGGAVGRSRSRLGPPLVLGALRDRGAGRFFGVIRDGAMIDLEVGGGGARTGPKLRGLGWSLPRLFVGYGRSLGHVEAAVGREGEEGRAGGRRRLALGRRGSARRARGRRGWWARDGRARTGRRSIDMAERKEELRLAGLRRVRTDASAFDAGLAAPGTPRLTSNAHIRQHENSSRSSRRKRQRRARRRRQRQRPARGSTGCRRRRRQTRWQRRRRRRSRLPRQAPPHRHQACRVRPRPRRQKSRRRRRRRRGRSPNSTSSRQRRRALPKRNARRKNSGKKSPRSSERSTRPIR